MAKSRKFSFRRLANSFGYAGKGIAWVWHSEPNFRAHCIAAGIVLFLGFLLKINFSEWIAVVLCIGIVTGAEAFNSALEALADATHPEQNPMIAKAKDASAGAVLLASLAASAVGAMIFLPKLWQLMKTMLSRSG